MTNDSQIATLLWYYELSDEDKIKAIRENHDICYLMALFKSSVPEECRELCDSVMEFNEL